MFLVAYHLRLFVTLWTVACHFPLSVGFSRQEYWSRLPCPLPGDLSDAEITPGSPALQADCLPPEPPGKTYSLVFPLFSSLSFPISAKTTLLVLRRCMVITYHNTVLFPPQLSLHLFIHHLSLPADSKLHEDSALYTRISLYQAQSLVPLLCLFCGDTV